MEGERQRRLGALMLTVKKRREARRLDPLLFSFWTQMTCLQSHLVILESAHDLDLSLVNDAAEKSQFDSFLGNKGGS